MLPSIGVTEAVILSIVVLLLFGAKRIPELAKSLGSGVREFRKGIWDRDDDQVKEHKGHTELPEAKEEVRTEAERSFTERRVS